MSAIAVHRVAGPLLVALRAAGAFSVFGFLALLAACGGGGGGGSGAATAPPPAAVVTLSSIAVAPASTTLKIKGTITLAATGTYSDGTTKAVTVAWTSSPAAVASVGASTGVVTALTAGTTTITATSGAVTATATITVSPATLVSVAITPTAPTIAVGKTVQFSVTGTYSDGSTQPLTGASWISATPATATIGATTGLATAAALGTTSISATIPGQATPAPVTLTVAATVYAYATNFDENTVSQYQIGINGLLTPLPTFTVAAGLKPFSVSVEPTGQYVYVANYGANTVSEFTIGAGGELSPVGAGTVATGREPNGVTIDPTDTHAYVANLLDNTISQFTIGSDGELIPLGTPVATGPNPASVTIEGKYAYVSNFGANSLTPPATAQTISQYTVGTDGQLTPMTPATVPSGAGPNAVTVTPNSQFAYAANDGDDTVSQYASNPVTGALTPILPATATGLRPFGLAVDPTSHYLYVANSGDGTISQYAITSTGVLTSIGAPVASGAGVTYVAVDATGKYVYGTNRGTTTISQFAITPGTGLLTPMTPPTVVSGTTAASHPTSIATGY
jgi:6-phosphogluconolactonase